MTKPVIVTRAGKGSALTWTEGDTNLTNLQDATITLTAGTGGTAVVSDLNGTVTLVAGTNVTLSGDNTAKTITINSSGGGGGLANVVEDTTPQLGGDLDTNGNKIVSTSNANIEIEPNGTGDVYLSADTVRVGDLDSTANIISNGAGDLNLTVGSANAGQIILRQGNDGNIEFVPHGSGSIYASSNTIRIGTTNQNATVTTTGTGDLILNTNSGSNSGTITIEDGTNGNILLAPNGTGKVVITEIIAPVGLGGDVTLSPDGTGNVNLNADTVRVGDNNADATVTTHGTGDLILNTNAGTNSGTIRIYDGSNGNIEITPNGTGKLITDYILDSSSLTLEGGPALSNSSTITLDGSKILLNPGTGIIELRSDVNLGKSNSNAYLSSNGTGDLILQTNGGTNSGTINIEDGVNGNIIIEPNGTGDLLVNADTVRVGDSGAAATITTNGAGQLTLSTDGTAAGKPSIAIASSTSGNLTISGSSTGAIVLGGVTIGATTSTTNLVAPITGRSVQTASNTTGRLSLIAQKMRSDITLASMTDEPVVIGFQVRDSANANRMIATQRATYTGTGANPIMYFTVSTDNYTNTVQTLNFNDTRAVWGNTNTNYTLTTNGTGNLTLNTNSGTNSGSIVINQGANANISITPNGTGKVILGTDVVNVSETKTPASAAATGTTGDIAWDADYIYVCTATDTWKRAAISTW